jgi:eukaryotic-like serine/threonine-protein kinase
VSYLNHHPEAVLVLDDIDPAYLNEDTPNGFRAAALKCRILFTTRRKHSAFSGEWLDVGALPEDDALDYAHAQGVIHGDVKPGNILLMDAAEGTARRAKLGDFGILRAVESSGVTSADMTRGTPYYISPEQAEGSAATPKADQYALGVVAYELFTGQVPFGGDTPLAIYLKHVREAPQPPSAVNSLVTPALEAVLLRALAKDPAERYANCQDFAAALREAVAATENEQFESLMAQAQQALKSHSPENARPLIKTALQIVPDDAAARALWEKLEGQERAQRSYDEAAAGLQNAVGQAKKLRAAESVPPDPDGLLDKLAPPAPPAWKTLLQRWQTGLILGAVVFVMGVLGTLIWSSYASSNVGTGHQNTLVALRYGTPTFTLTFTPTPTPTYTPTFTLTPSLTPTLTFTPTLTPTPLAGAIQISPKDGMVMVYVPAGEFEIGSEDGNNDEEPVHAVYLDSYWMDQTEVTYEQYQQFVQTESYDGDSGCGSGNHPVACVDWYGAQAYCEWAGRRLPTEAEWEKAARGGLEGMKYPWGNENPVCNSGAENGAKFDDNAGCNDTGTEPVMSYAANGYGLYDMAGNVWEWVSDRYAGDYYENSPDNNPTGPDSGNYRVLRGGSWNDNGRNVRSASRDRNVPSVTWGSNGFRCARSQ